MSYYRKRYYRRRNARKALSNYSIATKTGAKSQARQIYYLRKRISKIQRLTKPEIVTIQRNSSKINLISGQGSVTWIVGTGTTSGVIQPDLGPINNNVIGDVSSAVPNNFARLNSLRILGNMQYNAVSNTSVPVNLRLVIVQLRSSRQTTLSASDIFTSGSSSEDNFSAVFGPLQTGLSRTCKVLSDKRYCLSFQGPSINIRTPLKYLMSFYRDANSNASGEGSSDPIYKGSIYIFYAIYTAAVDPVGSLNLLFKLAYTDA